MNSASPQTAQEFSLRRKEASSRARLPVEISALNSFLKAFLHSRSALSQIARRNEVESKTSAKPVDLPASSGRPLIDSPMRPLAVWLASHGHRHAPRFPPPSRPPHPVSIPVTTSPRPADTTARFSGFVAPR